MFFPVVTAAKAYVSVHEHDALFNATAAGNITFTETNTILKVVSDAGDVICPLKTDAYVLYSKTNTLSKIGPNADSKKLCEAISNWQMCLSDCSSQFTTTIPRTTVSFNVTMNSTSNPVYSSASNVYDSSLIFNGDLAPRLNGMAYSGYIASITYASAGCPSNSDVASIELVKVYNQCTPFTLDSGEQFYLKSVGSATTNYKLLLCFDSGCNNCQDNRVVNLDKGCERMNITGTFRAYSRWNIPVLINSKGLTVSGFNDYKEGVPQGPNIALIVGCVVGGVVFVGAVIGGVIYWKYRNHKIGSKSPRRKSPTRSPRV